MRSTYHPDGYDDHGTYKGGIDGFIASLEKRHATVEQSMHVLANCLIEFAGADRALVETYFSTYQRLSPEAGDARRAYLRGAPIRGNEAVEGTVFGRYVDIFERRDGAWRVAKRTVVFEVYKGAPAPAGGGLGEAWTRATRDGNDPLDQERRKMGLA